MIDLLEERSREYAEVAAQRALLDEQLTELRGEMEGLLEGLEEPRYESSLGVFELVNSPSKIECDVDASMLPPKFQKIQPDAAKLRQALELGLDVPARLVLPEKPLTLRVRLAK